MDFLVFSFVVTVIAENPPQVVRPTATSLEVNLSPRGGRRGRHFKPWLFRIQCAVARRRGGGGKKKKIWLFAYNTPARGRYCTQYGARTHDHTIATHQFVFDG